MIFPINVRVSIRTGKWDSTLPSILNFWGWWSDKKGYKGWWKDDDDQIGKDIKEYYEH